MRGHVAATTLLASETSFYVVVRVATNFDYIFCWRENKKMNFFKMMERSGDLLTDGCQFSKGCDTLVKRGTVVKARVEKRKKALVSGSRMVD